MTIEEHDAKCNELSDKLDNMRVAGQSESDEYMQTLKALQALWLALRDERVTKRCTVSDDREGFHVVAKRLGWSIERYEDGTYMSVSADDGWQVWQAARTGLLAVLQEISSADGEDARSLAKAAIRTGA